MRKLLFWENWFEGWIGWRGCGKEGCSPNVPRNIPVTVRFQKFPPSRTLPPSITFSRTLFSCEEIILSTTWKNSSLNAMNCTLCFCEHSSYFDSSRSARFRWYQGVFTSQDLAPEWSIDNVYVGTACQGHCQGHGVCLHGMMCMCDDGYAGDNCYAAQNNPTALKEDFESK